MHRPLGRRLVAGLVAAAASTVLAAPAFAAAPRFAVVLPDVIVAAGAVTYLDPILVADQDATVTGAKITYELSGGLDGVSLADPGVFADCTNDGPAKLTCTSPSQTGTGQNAAFTNMIAQVSAEEAAPGETGKITLTFTADGVAPSSYTADVTVAEAVDLVAGEARSISVDPGRTFDASVQVRNNSEAAVHGAALFVHNDDAFAPREQYSNCFYSQGRLSYCVFDTDLTAGAGYQVDLPFRLQPDTYAPSTVTAGFEWVTGDEYANLLEFLQGVGPGIRAATRSWSASPAPAARSRCGNWRRSRHSCRPTPTRGTTGNRWP